LLTASRLFHRTVINVDQLRRFTVGDVLPEISTPSATVGEGGVIRSSRQIQYNVVDGNLLEKIQCMNILGSYGAKIEALVKHLLHVQEIEPGAKSIGLLLLYPLSLITDRLPSILRVGGLFD
jgi:E3 ubiquitin-protein ligase SHPRH